MKIISIVFERAKKYGKLATVFERSLKAVMPKTKYEIIKLNMPPNIDHKRDTAYAFLAAANYVLKQKQLIAVCDIDMMFLKPITDAVNLDFDIAVTTRNKMKYNTGLWFYRPNSRSKMFIRKWIAYTKIIMGNFKKYEKFSWDNGGIDQASLKWTIDKAKDIKLKELSCKEWNSTQSEWKNIDSKTRIVHIKSKLRTFIFKKIKLTKEYGYLKPIIKKWKSYL